MPRSPTAVDGMMVSGPILKGHLGSWCRRRAVAHQSNSDLFVFSWSRLDCFQLCTSSMHADRRCCRSCIADGLQRPDIWVSSAYRWGQKPCCSIRLIFCHSQNNAANERASIWQVDNLLQCPPENWLPQIFHGTFTPRLDRRRRP